MGNDNYRTPDYIFNYYDMQYHFICDVAASYEDHKCKIYYTNCDRGQKQRWYSSNFCNPPYSRKNGNKLGDWVARGFDGLFFGLTTVFILPLGFTSKWFNEFVKGKARIELPDERIEFINPETGKPDNQPRNDNMIIIYGPGIIPEIVSVHIPKEGASWNPRKSK